MCNEYYVDLAVTTEGCPFSLLLSDLGFSHVSSCMSSAPRNVGGSDDDGMMLELPKLRQCIVATDPKWTRFLKERDRLMALAHEEHELMRRMDDPAIAPVLSSRRLGTALRADAAGDATANDDAASDQLHGARDAPPYDTLPAETYVTAGAGTSSLDRYASAPLPSLDQFNSAAAREPQGRTSRGPVPSIGDVAAVVEGAAGTQARPRSLLGGGGYLEIRSKIGALLAGNRLW